MANRIGPKGLQLNATGHKVDSDLRAHWTGIYEGQTLEERRQAILWNIDVDKACKRRGIDPASSQATEIRNRKASRGISAQEAFVRIAALKR